MIRASTSERYWRTDEYTDVLDSIQFLGEQLQKVEHEPWRWKWIVISAHNALQGACVCALTRTDGTGPWKKDTESAVKKHLYGNDQDKDKAWEALGNAEVAPFGQLVQRLFPDIQVARAKDWTKAKNDSEKAVRMIHSIRNDLQHFGPQGWSIETSGLPGAVLEVLRLVGKAACEKHTHRHNRFEDIGLEECLSNTISKAREIQFYTEQSVEGS